MTRNSLAIVIFSFLFIGVARAATFDVPYEHPALTINVPASWDPNHSDDGVDAAAPDNTFFFSIYATEASGTSAVQSDSLKILSRNELNIEKQAKYERNVSLAGLNWVESEYSATEDGKARQIKLDVAHLAGRKFIQVFAYGSPKGMEHNFASFEKILGTIKLKKP